MAMPYYTMRTGKLSSVKFLTMCAFRSIGLALAAAVYAGFGFVGDETVKTHHVSTCVFCVRKTSSLALHYRSYKSSLY